MEKRAHPPLHRSPNDRVLAGVIGGLAASVGMTSGWARVVAVVFGVINPGIAVTLYTLMTLAVPVRGEQDGALSVEWQPDGLKLSWRGPVVPFGISWTRWALGTALVMGLVSIPVAALATLIAVVSSDVESLLLIPAVVCGLLPALSLVISRLPRQIGVTLTHEALWITRSGLSPRRIDLAEVEGIHRGQHGYDVMLHSGELIRLTPPAEDEALDAFDEQLANSRRRALEHRVDLADASEHRDRLQAILNVHQTDA